MALDNRYVTGFTLEQVFLDKNTGSPLSGGLLYFFEDDQRLIPKNVFELTGGPVNYTYAPLPNPIVLSSIGTIQNANGDNVALYAFPFAADGITPQLYYVVCTDSQGTPEFTRQAWPSTTANGAIFSGQANLQNELTNPQFAEVLWIPGSPLTITIAGAGTQNISIAPGWTLNVTTTGASTVTLLRNSITGITAYPSNPPYTLSVTPGANIAAISISQRLFHNPDIWSPSVAGSAIGYVASSILLAPLSSVTMIYAPSTGPQQIILAANNLGGVYAESNNTFQLDPATNPDNSNTGYVDIILRLPVGAGVTTTFSNVQVIGLQSNIQNISFDQIPVNRQVDYMFHYFNPLLQYKPIPSYLVGWDFSLNPAQPLGDVIAASAAGANTSRYVWDQTIVFQSANNGPAISRGTNGCLTVTATNATQFALVQYLEAEVARMILNDRNSVNVAAFTAAVGGLGGTISLWRTTDGALPSCAANNSIVATLDANGKPATFHGNWVEVPRSNLGDARFTVGASPNTTNFNNYGFSGWDMQGAATTNTATFFAIVVGFATLGAAATINIDSISLVPGDIPTRPAVQKPGEVLFDCQRYFYMTFEQGTVPAQAVGLTTGETTIVSYANGAMVITSESFQFPNRMVDVPTLTFYSPAVANAFAYDRSAGGSWTSTAGNYVTQSTYGFHGTQNAFSQIGFAECVHITADARLGA